MLRGISPLFSPELLATIYRMGHGDELVFADAYFPSDSLSGNVIRADGLKIGALLDAVLALMPLDKYVESPMIMMSPCNGDQCDKSVEETYLEIARKYLPSLPPPQKLERFAFYDRTRKSFAIVKTGDTSNYANLIVKKGNFS